MRLNLNLMRLILTRILNNKKFNLNSQELNLNLMRFHLNCTSFDSNWNNEFNLIRIKI